MGLTGKKLIIASLGLLLVMAKSVSALGEESVAISITLFCLASAIMVFCTPFIVKRFAKNELVHVALKNSIHALGIGLMFLNTGIMEELANSVVGWELAGALSLYLRIFGYLMVFLIAVTIWRTFVEIAVLKQAKRMGVNIDDE